MGYPDADETESNYTVDVAQVGLLYGRRVVEMKIEDLNILFRI